MNSNSVSVIIPSFNRAHLLPKILPSYIQENVLEIIIINDNSTDNTCNVVEALMKKYPLIKYIKSKKKIRQTGAKNIGIKMAKGKFCYFGDDDSVLKSGSILSLVGNANLYPNSVIASRHLYMQEFENLDTLLLDQKTHSFNDISDIYNKRAINLDLRNKYDKVIEIPFCTYCFLISSDIAKNNSFHEGFIKTCFREETDYIMQLRQKGIKVFLDPHALSIDLPRSVSKGGIYNVNFLSRHFGEAVNEFIFYKRNKSYLEQISLLNTNPYLRAISHLFKKVLK